MKSYRGYDPEKCERCQKTKTAITGIGLELNTSDNLYYLPTRVPQKYSQGVFFFCPKCAEKELVRSSLETRAGIALDRKRDDLKSQWEEYRSDKSRYSVEDFHVLVRKSSQCGIRLPVGLLKY